MDDLRATPIVHFPLFDVYEVISYVFDHPRIRTVAPTELRGLAYALARRAPGRIGVIADSLLPDALPRERRCSAPYGLLIAVGTLQGAPIYRRRLVLAHAAAHLIPGGSLLLVEHVRAADSLIDLALDQVAQLSATPATAGAITVADHEAALRATGFQRVECFWRRLTVAAWIALRDAAPLPLLTDSQAHLPVSTPVS